MNPSMLFAAIAVLFALGLAFGLWHGLRAPRPPEKPRPRPIPQPARPTMSDEDIVAALVCVFAVMSLGGRGGPTK